LEIAHFSARHGDDFNNRPGLKKRRDVRKRLFSDEIMSALNQTPFVNTARISGSAEKVL
jgi:hypothetical protein